MNKLVSIVTTGFCQYGKTNLENFLMGNPFRSNLEFTNLVNTLTNLSHSSLAKSYNNWVM